MKVAKQFGLAASSDATGVSCPGAPVKRNGTLPSVPPDPWQYPELPRTYDIPSRPALATIESPNFGQSCGSADDTRAAGLQVPPVPREVSRTSSVVASTWC